MLSSPVKPKDIGLDLSVCPSVCLSHFEGRCFVDITSSSMEVSRLFHSLSLQPRIADVQRQGFSLIRLKLSDLQPSELRQNPCFPQPQGGCFVDITSPSMEVPRGFLTFIQLTTKNRRCATSRFQFDRSNIVRFTAL